MRKFKVLVVLAIVAAFTWVGVASVQATPEIMKEKGKKTCTDCHTKGEKPSKDNATMPE